MSNLDMVYLYNIMNKDDVDVLKMIRRRNKKDFAYEYCPLRIFEVSVNFYEELESIQNTLKYSGLKYKYEIIGWNNNSLSAVFWLSEKPKQFIKLLKKNVKLNEKLLF